jgi:hypothetical protein
MPRADLGGNERLVSLSLQRLANYLFRIAVAVQLSGVDDVDAKLQGAVNDAVRLINAKFIAPAPTSGAELPCSQANCREPKAAYLNVPHGLTPALDTLGVHMQTQ